MDNRSRWTLYLGRWGGLHIRLHASFFMLAVLAYLFAWQSRAAYPESVQFVSCGLVILFGAVLLRELARQLLARRLGGGCDQVILGACGGVGRHGPTLEPRHELMLAAVGPLINLVAALLSAGILMSANTGVAVGQLFSALPPTELFASAMWMTIVSLIVWVNWSLLLLNVLPAFPFDGGWALRAILSMHWPDVDWHSAGGLVASMAKVAAIGMLLLACLSWSGPAADVVPSWFPLVVISMTLLFVARDEELRSREQAPRNEWHPLVSERGAHERGADDRAPRAAMDLETDESFERWLEEQRRQHAENRQQAEAAEERHLDDVLTRLHQFGMESLTAEDRIVLHRMSVRYRSRPSST